MTRPHKASLRPLLALPILLLALLVPGVAIASLLLRKASRRARHAQAVGSCLSALMRGRGIQRICQPRRLTLQLLADFY